jgi:AbiV family abortive infection protein
MVTVVPKARLAEGACFALKHAVDLLLTAAGLRAKRCAASFAMAVMAREEHGRFNLLAERHTLMSDADTIDALALFKELRDHKLKLNAGQSVTPVPMSESDFKEWEAACLAGDDVAASAISNRIRALAVKLKPHQVSELHDRRMRAQYVDIDVNTGTWITPSSITQAETDTLLRTIHAELANTLIAAPRSPWLRDAQSTFGFALPAMGEFSHAFFEAFACDA